MSEEKIDGHDIRIPMPNDDDFEKQVEWQIDHGPEPKPGEKRTPTRIFYSESDVRQYLCWRMLVTSFQESVHLSVFVRRVERFIPKKKTAAPTATSK